MWKFGLIDQRVVLNCSHMLEVPILQVSLNWNMRMRINSHGCTDMAKDEPSLARSQAPTTLVGCILDLGS